MMDKENVFLKNKNKKKRKERKREVDLHSNHVIRCPEKGKS